MQQVGFTLTRLTLKGSLVFDAEIVFREGLNVISGPSDTGKSFIVQCIDFMLGSSQKPKKIPQIKKYETIELALKTDTDEFVLERSLRGGDFQLYRNGTKDRVLAEKHSPDKENNISFFLLKLSGLTGKKIRVNKEGKTRGLSFRDIARLTLINEERIITEDSPILSGQYTTKTVELSVFRLLLTGIDDSSIIVTKKDDSKTAKGKEEGKLEILLTFLEKVDQEIAQLKANDLDLHAGLNLAESIFDSLSNELINEQQIMSSLEEKRRNIWKCLQNLESKLNVLEELQPRFQLLQEQYQSDLRRLETISEVSRNLGNIKEESCPICGAPPEHHLLKPDLEPEITANACYGEMKKIQILSLDLKKVIENNEYEISYQRQEKRSEQVALNQVNEQIQQHLASRIQKILEKLKESQVSRDFYKNAINLYIRKEELNNQIVEISNKSKLESRTDKFVTAIGADETEEFTKKTQSILASWNFPNLDRVTFSEEDNDILISGQKRSNHGKGVRAITHAAFNLALLQYCQQHSLPNPRLLLLDSPLVVYREPDASEDNFTTDVQQSFYRNLAKADFKNTQIIVIENIDPPEDLVQSINLIRFTGKDFGRKGFIPDYQDIDAT
jgi:hypothetical protein